MTPPTIRQPKPRQSSTAGTAATRLRLLLEEERERQRSVSEAAGRVHERPPHEDELVQLAAVCEEQARVFEVTLSSIADFAYIFDRDGRFVYANKALLDLWGLPLTEAVGKNFFDLHYPPDLAARLQRQVQHVFDSGETVRDETPYTSPSGKPGFYEYIFTPVWNPDGTMDVVAGSTRDITARKAVETELATVAATGRFLLLLDDVLRPLADPEVITNTAATVLGTHLQVDRCAYATVEEDEDTFLLTGNYTDGVHSIVGRYTFRQFGEECRRLMRAGEPYVVSDSATDPRIDAVDREAYRQTAISAVICVPILKSGRFVAAMAVHSQLPREWQTGAVHLTQQVASRCWESIERAKVTRTLRESENQFRQLANSIANLAWMARPDGVPHWYNQTWYDYTGMTLDAMQGTGWKAVHDPSMLPVVVANWQAAVESGEPFEMVFPIRGRDGTFRRFLTRANPFRDELGNIAGWFGTNTDVETERRAAESLRSAERERTKLLQRERLARKEAELQKRLLHSLFLQAPTLIAILRGPDHRIELANPRMCELWGHSLSDLKDRPLFEAMPDLQDQGFEAWLDEVFATGNPYMGTEAPMRLRRHDGEVTLYFDFVYSPFRNVAGDIEGVFMIASDVTEPMLARRENEGFRRAAESANLAKDEFLAMLGHELRNPLAPILTALQLMKLRGVNTAERERIVIERQVSHLTRLVDDLLDVSRIAQGKVELRARVIEVSEVVANALELTIPLLEEREHRLVLDVPSEGLLIEGDPTRLAQIVSNLISNAAKYTNHGGLVTVSAWKEGGTVSLTVKDTGVGISPDAIHRIFDLFVQGRQESDRETGGLGLGLAIVRNLVERHGGSVSAQSRGLGHGSTFTIRLPEAAPSGAPLVSSHQAAPPIPQPERPQRVLIVDDNEDAAALLAQLLSAKGHTTRVAHDGPSALVAAQAFAPEVAVLDIGLPVMDGYELAERLRELPGLGPMTLVALTGYGQAADRARSLVAGFHHHLVKPVDFTLLDHVLASPPRS